MHKSTKDVVQSGVLQGLIEKINPLGQDRVYVLAPEDHPVYDLGCAFMGAACASDGQIIQWWWNIRGDIVDGRLITHGSISDFPTLRQWAKYWVSAGYEIIDEDLAAVTIGGYL